MPSSVLKVAWPCVIAAAVSLAGGSAAAQQPPDSTAYAVAGTDSASVAHFVATLQHAAAANDSVAIAGLIDYRQENFLWNGTSARRYATRAAFLRAYHLIFDGRMRREIAAVTPDSLFANYQGVMFNSGRVWFDPDREGRLRIVTINAPVRPPAPHKHTGRQPPPDA